MKTKIKQQTQRLPRPYLFTEMMARYNSLDDGDIKSELGNNMTKYVVNNWSVNNGVIFGKYMSISELSDSLKIPIENIHMFLREKLTNINIFDKDNVKDLSFNLVNMVMATSIDDRNAILNQADILRRSQGDEYKAFISSEYNKILKIQLESTSQLSNLIKSLFGNSSITINNTNGDDNSTVISIDEINEQINMQFAETFNDTQKRSELADKLYDTYSIDQVPEVRAIDQGDDIDISREGIESGLNQIEMTRITDDYTIHIEDTLEKKKERRRKKHTNRRANDLGIDLENS